jgi:glucosamine-6-phosphate deaminase
MHKSNRVTMNMLSLYLAESRLAMGRRAAEDVASAIRTLLEKQVGVRMIFAAAPSQAEMLAALREQPGIDWKRVTAFHMDEYIGLSVSAPQRFALWLRQHIFDHLPFEAIHCIEPGVDPEQTAAYYGELLNEAPIDIVCCGIGSNGHLAFNDPPAILDDPLTAKVVTLDLACRQQQVDDGCFATLADVPREAITLTVPTLIGAKRIYCCVPGTLKQLAVRSMVHEPISGACPATALRRHPHCTVYLDQDSAALLG